MLVVRSPLRIGLAGGGSDLPEHFARRPGAVLGLTFAKYVYVAMLPLAPMASENIRFTYRYSESVMNAYDIEHPVAREVLSQYEIPPKVNIATMADLPGGTGLGSSSAFTAAFLAGLDAFEGRWRSPDELARAAIHVERVLLKEAGGWQDQAQTAFGGFRLYEFHDDDFTASPPLQQSWVDDLGNHLVLAYAGLPPRRSRDQQSGLTQRIVEGDASRHLEHAANVAREAFTNLQRAQNLDAALAILGEVVREGWEDKKASGKGVDDRVEALLHEGIRRGAAAGKLLGAGGSGFVLFVLKEQSRAEFVRNWPTGVFTDVDPSHRGTELVLGDLRSASEVH